jgi:hypothetical protein
MVSARDVPVQLYQLLINRGVFVLITDIGIQVGLTALAALEEQFRVQISYLAFDTNYNLLFI